jgi:hypothetical protein
MGDDDWRNWKDGKYDNRYHGVRRHSGRKYYGRSKSRALPATIISVGFAIVFLFVLIVGIPGLPQINIPNFIETKPSQTPSTAHSEGQSNLPVTNTTSPVVWSSCTMVSNGIGGIRINCANHDSIQCTSNPPIGSGIQKDTTLKIDKNDCIVQYYNPQGSNVVYHFQLGVSPDNESSKTGTSDNPATNTPPSSTVPKMTFPKFTMPKVTLPTIPIPTSSNDQSVTQPTDLPSLYAYALKIVNDDRKA